ncbi:MULTISPECIES: 3'-5' exonuclease family protein [Acidithiobacillus]|uniref:3'-5' exonuclease family protein n=1 Tax=Acidithiobacillus TaxID=119977 RepID=UPI000AB15793|nr:MULTISPECIES: exonuclease domain-containing protein [Acidithiobacillus]
MPGQHASNSVAEGTLPSPLSSATATALRDLAQELDTTLAFIDLENTGGHLERDRIIEVGIILVAPAGEPEVWSTLINPEIRLSPAISTLTGIDPADLAHAPTFAQVAEPLREKLAGRLLIAHDARTDLAFLRQEWRRLGQVFTADVLCTLRLSRSLFPDEKRHGLDAIIERLQLHSAGRHRALTDARTVAIFLARLYSEQPARLLEACRQQWQRPALPGSLDAQTLDALPDRPGVYLCYDEADSLLYVGKSIRLRERVWDHFYAATSQQREMRLVQQIRRLEWIETPTELSALLLEARLIKERQPILNRRLRRRENLFTIAWEGIERGSPRIVPLRDCDGGELYGSFANAYRARQSLRRLARRHGLCLKALGLEKPTSGPCFAHQLKQCRGACCGAESRLLHDLRLSAALRHLRIEHWPWDGPMVLVEEGGGQRLYHLLWQWIHCGYRADPADLATLWERREGEFDMDIYRICFNALSRNRGTWMPLAQLLSPSGPQTTATPGR